MEKSRLNALPLIFAKTNNASQNLTVQLTLLVVHQQKEESPCGSPLFVGVRDALLLLCPAQQIHVFLTITYLSFPPILTLHDYLFSFSFSLQIFKIYGIILKKYY